MNIKRLTAMTDEDKEALAMRKVMMKKKNRYLYQKMSRNKIKKQARSVRLARRKKALLEEKTGFRIEDADVAV